MPVKPVVHKLPNWMPMGGITFGKHVFVKSLSYVPHESVHVQQQYANPVWFWVSYLLLLPIGLNPWRRDWEAEAYAVDVKSGLVTLEQAAEYLSGGLYLWPCSAKQAAAAIQKFMRK